MLWSTFCLAQPDPRDSIIIESKVVAPSEGPLAAVVRVYITNKDTLANVTAALVERSVSGGAYMALAWPRSFGGVVTPLTTTLPDFQTFIGNRYNSASPDTFAVGSFTTSLSTLEPPNSSRKAFWEIKFDTVRLNTGASGKVEIDTASRILENYTMFVKYTTEFAAIVRPNFVKGTITVSLADPGFVPSKKPKWWDMNLDGSIDAADAVLLLNCVFLGAGECRGATSSDVVRLLNEVYLGGERRRSIQEQ